MSFKTHKSLALYLGGTTEETLIRNRMQVASELRQVIGVQALITKIAQRR